MVIDQPPRTNNILSLKDSRNFLQRALVFVAFTLLLFAQGSFLRAIVACVTILISRMYPRGRWLFLACGTLACSGISQLEPELGRYRDRVAILWPLYHSSGLRVGIFLLTALFCVAYRETIRRLSESHFLRRHAFFIFFSLVLALAFLSGFAWAPGGLAGLQWWIIFNLSLFIPYVFYELESLTAPELHRWWHGLIFLRPFWQVVFVAPIPRGRTDLGHQPIPTPERWDTLQRSGLKLLVWATALNGTQIFVSSIVFDVPVANVFAFAEPFRLHLPDLRELVIGERPLAQVACSSLWLIIVVDFLMHFLRFAYWGHTIISVVRMLGFDAFRNTYRPFESKSLAEFFGRFNFYYKEILWRAFFFPAFRRFFRGRLRARIIFAVFVSVGLGNFLLLLVRDSVLISSLGPLGILQAYSVYAVYCVTLSIALSLSLMLSFDRPRARRRWTQVIAVASYVLFFSILRVFDDAFVGDIHMNLAVFSRLFGL